MYCMSATSDQVNCQEIGIAGLIGESYLIGNLKKQIFTS